MVQNVSTERLHNRYRVEEEEELETHCIWILCALRLNVIFSVRIYSYDHDGLTPRGWAKGEAVSKTGQFKLILIKCIQF